MREVRGLLRGDRLSQRFRRLDRMESAARVWVNGRRVADSNGLRKSAGLPGRLLREFEA